MARQVRGHEIGRFVWLALLSLGVYLVFTSLNVQSKAMELLGPYALIGGIGIVLFVVYMLNVCKKH